MMSLLFSMFFCVCLVPEITLIQLHLINCSTFGGNPLASAVAIASLKVVKDEGLVERYINLLRETPVTV